MFPTQNCRELDGSVRSALYHYCRTDCKDDDSPYAPLIMDKLGNLYAVAEDVGLGGGTVMMLAKKGKKYKTTVLYSFCTEANCTDGKHPWAPVTLSTDGTLFGTTNEGGSGTNDGVVFAIKP